MPTAVIRLLTPADAADYRAIRLRALEESPAAFGSTHAAEVARPLQAFAERLAGSTVFGAYAGDAIVGLVGYKREEGAKDAHKAFVWGFYVEPGSRRAGTGAALLAALIEEARLHVEQLRLDVVRQNQAAIALYQKAGFVIYGIEPRALKEADGYSDAVLMALLLK